MVVLYEAGRGIKLQQNSQFIFLGRTIRHLLFLDCSRCKLRFNLGPGGYPGFRWLSCENIHSFQTLVYNESESLSLFLALWNF